MPAAKTRVITTIVDFDPVELQAPFILRCGALLIDYIFIVAAPIIALVIGKFMGSDGSKLLNSELSNAGWLIAILLAITNFLILPMFAGQSIGKMLTGLRIVDNEGNMPSFKSLLLRHTLGYAMTVMSLFVGFLISLLSSKGRALHDYVASTIVIYATKKERNTQ